MRRRAAVALRKSGMSIREVADEVGCVPASVVRWEQAFDRNGHDGLAPKPQAGGKARLSDQEKQRLVQMVIQGARADGWKNDLWTLKRVGHFIERELGVHYHISNVHGLLRELGFSNQKPAQILREQNRAAIDTSRRTTWPATKRGPSAVGARSR